MRKKHLKVLLNLNILVVVFNEADSLSKDAQAALRRTMEKYMGNLRMILCCTSASKIISPVRSRCLLLRIPAPSDSEISAVLYKVADGETFDLPSGFVSRLVKESKGNLRKALLMLEASRVAQ
jgi:replication factor C subunit 3/5